MFATRFRPADALISGLLLFLAAALIAVPAAAGSGNRAERVIISHIYMDNNAPSEAYSLNDDAVIEVTGRSGITLTVEIKDGEVRVSEAGCPGHDCVKTGKISRDGQSIVCIPAGIIITVDGGRASGKEANDGIAG